MSKKKPKAQKPKEPALVSLEAGQHAYVALSILRMRLIEAQAAIVDSGLAPDLSSTFGSLLRELSYVSPNINVRLAELMTMLIALEAKATLTFNSTHGKFATQAVAAACNAKKESYLLDD